MLLTMFWPSFNYQLLIMTLMAFPLIGMFIVWRSNGSVRFDGQPVNSFHNTIFLSSSMAICSLGIRAVMDYQYLSVSPLWIPTASIAGVYWLLVLGIDQEERKVTAAVTQFMVSAAYAVSAVFLANCVVDSHPGESNINTVMDKHTSLHVKGPPSYELTIGPWKYSTEPSEISVRREIYDQLKVGERIEILVKEGVFDAPWVAAVNGKPTLPM
ncbi:MAG: hypothetical protein QM706_01035 [Nitrospira sp.]